MPDHKLPELGGRTPLEVADTPNLDAIAKRAEIFGAAKTIPDPLPPGSDVGNLAVLGYDPRKYYTGRSPLEAASIGVTLGETDVTVRCNLVTLAEKNGQTFMEDYSAGHITDDDAACIIEDLKKEIDGKEFSLSQGVSYRHLLLWREGNSDIRTTPPHDISGKEIGPWLPSRRGDGKTPQPHGKIQRDTERPPREQKEEKPRGKIPPTPYGSGARGQDPICRLFPSFTESPDP